MMLPEKPKDKRSSWSARSHSRGDSKTFQHWIDIEKRNETKRGAWLCLNSQKIAHNLETVGYSVRYSKLSLLYDQLSDFH
jgi:hypothetical protein